MSVFNFLPNFAKAMRDCPLKDPGNAGSISVRQSGMLHLVSAAAETRTLPAPGAKGTILLIDMETDGGDITLTVTGGYNEAGATSLVFSDVGQFAAFVSIQTAAGTYVWRLLSSSGTAVNTLLTQGAALTAQDTTITHTAPGTADYAIQGITSTTPFGFVTADEGNTVLKVIANLQTRLAEVEARLEGAGIIAAN